MENKGMKKEIWREVKGFSNCFISNYGRVWNKRRSNGKPSFGTQFNRGGYRHIHWINDLGEDCQLQVHQLMAIVFCDLIINPGGKTQIDHIDGNPSNNAVWNLRWVTPKENSHNLIKEHRSQKGIFQSKRRKVEGYTVKEQTRELSFKTISDIARYYKCSPCTIKRIETLTQKKNGYGIVSISHIKGVNGELFNVL